MTENPRYPKRLIEVDLPIKRISVHARREKSIRHGHISTLHIWWARRPLAACRAVICASLWPDPADPLCPDAFRKVARAQMKEWATSHLGLMSQESYPRFNGFAREPKKLDDMVEIRKALLDFIADFADWDNSTVREYLDTSRALTQAAHEALGGAPGTRPLVVDPFAGGGSIPLEALRVGGDTFASDLNPIPVLLNKIILEYIPKYGQRLADEVQKWGNWVTQQAAKELAGFYPNDPDGATPIAYLWARTILCEGPGCGAEVPLIRSLWLAKKDNRATALQLVPNPSGKRVDFKIIVRGPNGWFDQSDMNVAFPEPNLQGTSANAKATCPCCGFTNPKMRVRAQLVAKAGGTLDARLTSVLTLHPSTGARRFRLPTVRDEQAVRRAEARLEELERREANFLPDESLPNERVWKNNPIRVHLYGMVRWRQLFSPRQLIALTTAERLILEAGRSIADAGEPELASAVQSSLACVLSKVLDRNNALARWEPNVQCSQQLFGRQAIPMIWDFGEPNPFAECAGSWPGLLHVWLQGLPNILGALNSSVDLGDATVVSTTATMHPLPDDSCHAFITDPPYYDAVPYSTLANFFYVWLKRTAPLSLKAMFSDLLSPSAEECVVDEAKGKTHAFYESHMTASMTEGRRILQPSGIAVVVFAHKSTSGWEALLQALISGGWIVTGSWPIDTEMSTRLRAQDSAALASSIHLVCRPRENPDGSVRTDEIGDWRDVLQELPRRIHDWMPRLAEEGVVGADAIFACLGPALEVFSRYSRVDKASGETVTLKEYLEHVWAAVSREAISVIFQSADTSGLDPDARLTAVWLWTLVAPVTVVGGDESSDGDSEADDEESDASGPSKTPGFVLEFDAARKIAQGLGANLTELSHVVEVKGDKARLLSASERSGYLFGAVPSSEQISAKKRGKRKQLALFEEVVAEAEQENWGDLGAPRAGATTLDRIHQAMLLFGTGRSEALKRFLVEEGVGHQAPFGKLAQALSALYPVGTDEKRWVDGVLARKKALGFA